MSFELSGKEEKEMDKKFITKQKEAETKGSCI